MTQEFLTQKFSDFTPDAQEAMQLALEEAQNCGNHNIHPSHLLAGIAKGSGPGNDILKIIDIKKLIKIIDRVVHKRDKIATGDIFLDEYTCQVIAHSRMLGAALGHLGVNSGVLLLAIACSDSGAHAILAEAFGIDTPQLERSVGQAVLRQADSQLTISDLEHHMYNVPPRQQSLVLVPPVSIGITLGSLTSAVANPGKLKAVIGGLSPSALSILKTNHANLTAALEVKN